MFAHLFCEFVETSVKLSQFYFDKTAALQQYCQKYDALDCGLFGFLRKKIFDDSTYQMWTIRYSIDIMIRFNISVVTSIWSILRLLIMTESGYNKVYQNDNYYKSIVYAIVVFFAELIYYLVSIYGHMYHHPQNDIISNFKSFWSKFQKPFILYWISVLLLGYKHTKSYRHL